MKKAATVFYSFLATFLVLECLMTSWMVLFYREFFKESLFAGMESLFISTAILLIFVYSLYQVYLLHIKGKNLTAVNYWILLALNSAGTVYLKNSAQFISADYLKFNVVLVAISFFSWLMFLLLGVLYNSISKTSTAEIRA